MGNLDQKMESDQNLYPNLLSSTSLDKSDKGDKRRSSEDLFAVHDFNIEIDLEMPASSEYRGSLPPYTTVLNYFDCLWS